MANDTPLTVDFDANPELKALRDELLAMEPGKTASEYEVNTFAPRFADDFAGLPLHAAPPNLQKPRVLISVLGFSPVPVAYMAAWAKPEAMLCIATEDSAKQTSSESETVAKRIQRVAGLSAAPEVRKFDEHADLDIYTTVRDFIRQHGAEPHEVFVDPTGGKKSMSAATALAAYREGAVLVYVDYTRYSKNLRRPEPGTEYPRYLRNPLVELAEDEFDRIAAAFNRGAYLEALRRSEELGRQSYEYPREALMHQHLTNGYHEWELGRFQNAANAFNKFLTQYETFHHRSHVARERLAQAAEAVPAHRTLLDTLHQATTEGTNTPGGTMPLVLNDLAQAQRLLKRGENRWAVVTLSVALERYLQHYAKSRLGLIDLRPDDERIPWEAMDRAARSHSLKTIDPHESNRIGMGVGLLLAAATKPDFPLGKMWSIADRRNQLAHAGDAKAPTTAKLHAMMDHFRDMLATMENLKPGAIDAQLAPYQFIRLPGAE